MPSRARKDSTKGSARAKKGRKATGTEQPAGNNLFSFTIDASTGQLVTVESLDAAGTRKKVSDRQKKTIAREGRAKFEEVLVEAFEAGIDCVLGDGDEALENSERERDAELRHDLVAPLMQSSPAKRLLKREVLDRAILGTLIQHSISPAGQTPRTP
jgi:hypothetical protein